jgi:protein-L-isoaspartate(D-aspartate) O-methyltransferase
MQSGHGRLWQMTCIIPCVTVQNPNLTCEAPMDELRDIRLRFAKEIQQRGCGVGYYSAIAAHALGPQGAVVAVELDAALAARAERNLQPYPTVRVIAADGTRQHLGTFDAIFVNAGCTRVAPIWLDQLAVGGRLLVPLTVGIAEMPGIGAGAMLLVTRLAAGYGARFTSPVGIFHCEGARSAAEEAKLSRALSGGNRSSVCRLRRDVHDPGASCWLHTHEVCLTGPERIETEADAYGG